MELITGYGGNKMRAKEYLEQVYWLDDIIANKNAEIEYWKGVAEGTSIASEGERVQSSGNHQKMAAAVCRYVELEKDVKRLEGRRDEIIKTIEKLRFPEYDLLHKVYIQGKLLKEVVADKKKSQSWGTATHKKALRNLQKLIDERGVRNGKKI